MSQYRKTLGIHNRKKCDAGLGEKLLKTMDFSVYFWYFSADPECGAANGRVREPSSYACTSVGDPWCGSGSASPGPYLWLIDPYLAPDPIPFFNNFKDAKKTFFLLFNYNLPTVHHFQS